MFRITIKSKVNIKDSNEFSGRWQVRYSDAPRSAMGSIETVQGYGGRGISVHQTQTFSRLYDTEDELERKEFENYASTFNGEASNGGFSPLQQVDQRSDDHVSCGALNTKIEMHDFNYFMAFFFILIIPSCRKTGFNILFLISLNNAQNIQ